MAAVAFAFWIVVVDFGAYILYEYGVLGAKKVFDLDAIQNPYWSSEWCVNPDLGLFLLSRNRLNLG